MKKFGIKFLLSVGLFFSFSSLSFGMRIRMNKKIAARTRKMANSQNNHLDRIEVIEQTRGRIVNCIVDEQSKEFDLTVSVESNISGSITTFVESINLLEAYSEEQPVLRDELIQSLHLEELASILGIRLNKCVDDILRECDEKIVSRILNKPNLDGITLLQLAVNLKHWEMALELIRNGAHAFLTDSYGTIIGCVLFDRNLPLFREDIPEELFEQFQAYLTRELSSRCSSIYAYKRAVHKFIFPVCDATEITSRASLFRNLLNQKKMTKKEIQKLRKKYSN